MKNKLIFVFIISALLVGLFFSTPNSFGINDDYKPDITIKELAFTHDGKNLNDILLGQLVGVKSYWSFDIKNEKSYTAITQIKDQNGQVVFLDYYKVDVRPKQEFNPEFYWYPEKQGKYDATVFVWKSIEEPIPLSKPVSKSISVKKTNCDVHPLASNGNIPHTLIPAQSLLLSVDEFASLVTKSANDYIIKKDHEDDISASYITDKGHLTVNKHLEFPKAEYVIEESFFQDGNFESELHKKMLDDLGYVMYGVEQWINIGAPYSQKMVAQQNILGKYVGSTQYSEFYFTADEAIIKIGRWYQNASCIEPLISEEEAKDIAYAFVESESKKDQQMINRGIVPQMSENVEFKIIDDKLVYWLTAGVGPNHHPEGDSPNCVWVYVDSTDGKVLGWESCFFNV